MSGIHRTERNKNERNSLIGCIMNVLISVNKNIMSSGTWLNGDCFHLPATSTKMFTVVDDLACYKIIALL